MKNYLCLMFLVPLFSNCGEEETRYVKKKRPTPPASYEFQGLIDDNCNNCHGKSIGSAFQGELKGNARKRLENGTMPPGGKIDADVKAKLLGE